MQRMMTALVVLCAGLLALGGTASAAETGPSAPGRPSVQEPRPAAGAPVRPAPSPKGIALNFDNADIATVVQAVSEIVGFNYVLAPDVRGTVTLHTAAPLRPEDVFPVFLSILEVNGFTAVRTGAIWKIV